MLTIYRDHTTQKNYVAVADLQPFSTYKTVTTLRVRLKKMDVGYTTLPKLAEAIKRPRSLTFCDLDRLGAHPNVAKFLVLTDCQAHYVDIYPAEQTATPVKKRKRSEQAPQPPKPKSKSKYGCANKRCDYPGVQRYHGCCSQRCMGEMNQTLLCTTCGEHPRVSIPEFAFQICIQCMPRFAYEKAKEAHHLKQEVEQYRERYRERRRHDYHHRRRREQRRYGSRGW